MAYRKLSPVDLIAAIQRRVEEGTGLRCYDHVPMNAKSPFYFAELVRIRPSNSKTMYRDVSTVWVHCIAEPVESSVGVYDLIEGLEEAMSIDVDIPEPFELIMQTSGGLQTLKTDETNEKHAVVSYDFTICYGFMCKN